MALGAKQHAVRRFVLTVIATAVCLSLWSNNKNLKSSQEELESSLKRRRLLVNEDAGKEKHKLSTDIPSFDKENKETIPIRSKLPKSHLVTASPDGGKSEPTEETKPTRPKESEKPPVENTFDSNEETKVQQPTDKPSENENGESTDGTETKVEKSGTMSPKDGSSGGEGITEEGIPKAPVATGEEDMGNHQAVPGTTARKDPNSPSYKHKQNEKGQPVPQPVTTSTERSNGSQPTAVPIEEECTPPAYHEFPPDLFTHKQRSRGAVVIHIAVIIYMFYAVAVVCDDYFIASLEECCSRLNLSEDVAGATFMAAGSSAPELFTAILGVLVAKGDVGTGTIVGSAVFNVLFVIGICGIFSGRIVELTWWPLFRDSVFYSCTVIILISIIYDSEVTWYESVIMMVIYAGYIVLMKFNNDVHFWVSRRLGIEDETGQNVGILAQGDKKTYSSYVPFNNEIDECAHMPVTAHFSVKSLAPDESISKTSRILSIHEASLVFLMRRQFRPITRFRAAAGRIIIEQRRLRKETNRMQGQISIESQDSGQKWKPKNIRGPRSK